MKNTEDIEKEFHQMMSTDPDSMYYPPQIIYMAPFDGESYLCRYDGYSGYFETFKNKAFKGKFKQL